MKEKCPSWGHIPVSLPDPVDKAGMMQAAVWTPHSKHSAQKSRREFQLNGLQPLCQPSIITQAVSTKKRHILNMIIRKTAKLQYSVTNSYSNTLQRDRNSSEFFLHTTCKY